MGIQLKKNFRKGFKKYKTKKGFKKNFRRGFRRFNFKRFYSLKMFKFQLKNYRKFLVLYRNKSRPSYRKRLRYLYRKNLYRLNFKRRKGLIKKLSKVKKVLLIKRLYKVGYRSQYILNYLRNQLDSIHLKNRLAKYK